MLFSIEQTKNKSLIDVENSTVTLKLVHIEKFQGGTYINMNTSSAVLENCNLTSTDTKNDTVFIGCVNSTVTMKSLLVERFQGGVFLQVIVGRVHIQHSQFLKCASVPTLINIFNDSVLSVDNCTFTSNEGWLIYVEIASIGTLTNCVFRRNSVVSNSTQYGLTLVTAYLDSSILLDNCSFVNNTIHKGATLAIIKSIGMIENSVFKENTGNIKYTVGAVFTNNSRMLRINRSNFSNNVCGGVSSQNSLNIFILSCSFHNNSAKEGAGLFLHTNEDMQNNDSLNFHKITEVLQKYHLEKQIVSFLEGIHLLQLLGKKKTTIKNCTFHRNSAEHGGGIAAQNVLLTLEKCTFMSNSAVGFPSSPGGNGGAIDLHYSPTNITACVFKGNKGKNGGAVQSAGVSLNIKSSVFVDNQVTDGGAISFDSVHITTHANLFVSNSTFQRNKGINGGAIFSSASLTTIQASTFNENTAISIIDAFCKYLCL